MKSFTLFSALALAYIGANAQQPKRFVVNSCGTTYTSSTAKLTYNLGEIAVKKIGNNNNSITQGFLQPKIITSSVNELSANNRFVAYPNPSQGSIKIESEHYKEPIQLQLFDGAGREIYKGTPANNSLSLDTYQNGIYQLLILDAKGQVLEHKTITKVY